MRAFRLLVTKRPRTVAAAMFGGLTMAVTHFAWRPDTRMGGWTLVLTFAVGVVHALAGAIISARLVDKKRTKTPFEACLLGALTSLLAQVLFAPLFSLWILSTSTGPESTLSFVVTTVLISFFSFLAIGWGFLLISIAVGWILYLLAMRPDEVQAQSKIS